NLYQQEIATANAQIKIAEEKIFIAKEAVKLSREALSQSIERQKLGTVKPFEVFQAQQFLLQAQVDYLKAVSENNKAQYALIVAMGNNL
nr:TolC family protein [Nitrosopumilus sp.]